MTFSNYFIIGLTKIRKDEAKPRPQKKYSLMRLLQGIFLISFISLHNFCYLPISANHQQCNLY